MRYLVFAGNDEIEGGGNEFIEAFETKREAHALMETFEGDPEYTWHHILDIITGDITY